MAAGDRDRWNEKWSAAGVGTDHSSALAELLLLHLPGEGRLLDVAGGGSPAAIEFGRHGLDVTVADISDVGLAQAARRAQDEGLSLETVVLDLEEEPLPPGPFDVITVANYLQRDLFPAMIDRLAPGGTLAVVIATVTNLDRHEKPGRPFLLERDELPTLVDGLHVVHHSEQWRPNGRHEAHLVARATP